MHNSCNAGGCMTNKHEVHRLWVMMSATLVDEICQKCGRIVRAQDLVSFFHVQKDYLGGYGYA